MFLQLIIAIIAGICVGIITGLTPGVHINLVSVLMLTAAPFLLKYTNVLSLCVFVVAMSVTHTFLDSLPSIFLGAPDSETALGVLPGHRYLLKGHGLMAVKLTIIGSFGGLLLSIILFPALIPIVGFIYEKIEPYMGYILIAVVIFMILRDNKKLWASFIFLLSGCLGLVVLNIPNFKDPLFPMLSGLFGVSTMLISLLEKSTIPEQKQSNEIKIDRKKTIKALLSSTFSGWIVATMPGLGGATAAVISMQITRDLGDHGFMVLMGGINTVNFVLSLVALYVLNKARNGSIIAVQKLISGVNLQIIIVFLCASLIAGGIAVFLALRIGRVFSKLITKVNYLKLVIGIITFVVIMVAVVSGPLGLLVLLVSTAVGILPAEVKVTRTHGMGCLLLPVILYFMF